MWGATNGLMDPLLGRRKRSPQTTLVVWLTPLLFVGAVAGFCVWLPYAVAARRSTNDALAAFGLEFANEPLLMKAITPTAIAYAFLAILVTLLGTWRARNVLGDTLSDTSRARKYVLSNATSNTFMWLMVAWVVVTIAGYTAWAVGTSEFDASAEKLINITSGWTSAMPQVPPLHGPRPEGQVAAPAGSGMPAAGQHQADPTNPWPLPPWGPDFPPGFCPPTCLDLSGVTWLAGETCVCDLPVKIEAAQPYAAAATRHLIKALIGLAAMYTFGSLFVASLAASFAQTTTELSLVGRLNEVFYIPATVRSFTSEGAVNYASPSMRGAVANAQPEP